MTVSRTFCRGRSRHDAGFMMVEALITMAISAMLLLGLASVTSLTFRALERATTVTGALESQSRVLAALARDIQGAARISFSGEDAPLIFSGTPGDLIYAETLTRAGERPDMRVVRLQVRLDGSNAVLSRSEAPLLPSARGVEELRFAQPEALFIGRALPRFAYVDASAGGEAIRDGWSDGAAMPDAVLVSFASEENTTSLRIPLRVNAEPACAISGSRFCTLAPVQVASPDSNAAEPIDPDDPLGWMRYAQ
ncbi:hypothetical protein [Mesorhizobium sp. CAU 1741]|uniref:PulJ/GspJ family protein n=1 Tax=Mesorhizobium sp. CAU 1741 TaxID=3140366 RepID=UPI00325BD58E